MLSSFRNVYVIQTQAERERETFFPPFIRAPSISSLALKSLEASLLESRWRRRWQRACSAPPPPLPENGHTGGFLPATGEKVAARSHRNNNGPFPPPPSGAARDVASSFSFRPDDQETVTGEARSIAMVHLLHDGPPPPPFSSSWKKRAGHCHAD